MRVRAQLERRPAGRQVEKHAVVLGAGWLPSASSQFLGYDETRLTVAIVGQAVNRRAVE